MLGLAPMGVGGLGVLFHLFEFQRARVLVCVLLWLVLACGMVFGELGV